MLFVVLVSAQMHRIKTNLWNKVCENYLNMYPHDSKVDRLAYKEGFELHIHHATSSTDEYNQIMFNGYISVLTYLFIFTNRVLA